MSKPEQPQRQTPARPRSHKTGQRQSLTVVVSHTTDEDSIAQRTARVLAGEAESNAIAQAGLQRAARALAASAKSEARNRNSAAARRPRADALAQVISKVLANVQRSRGLRRLSTRAWGEMLRLADSGTHHVLLRSAKRGIEWQGPTGKRRTLTRKAFSARLARSRSSRRNPR
jgi:hypothetical protein